MGCGVYRINKIRGKNSTRMDDRKEDSIWNYSHNFGNSVMETHIGGAERIGFRHSFTFMCWIYIFRFNTSQQLDNAIIGSSVTRDRETLHLIIRNRRPYFGFYANDTAGNTLLQENTWYHLCFVYNEEAKEQSIYVNGELDVVSAGHPPLRGNQAVYYSRYAEGRPLNGYLAVPRHWANASMSKEHIQAVMHLPSLTAIPVPIENLYGVESSWCRSISSHHKVAPYLETPDRFPPLKYPTRPLNWTDIITVDNYHKEFAAMYNNPKFSDITIKYGNGKEMRAHRIVLSCRSEYFKAMFDSDMLESVSGVINIQFPNHSAVVSAETDNMDMDVMNNTGKEAAIEDEAAADQLGFDSDGKIFELFLQLLYTYNFEDILQVPHKHLTSPNTTTRSWILSLDMQKHPNAAVNWLDDQGNILFHLNPRMHQKQVVMNTYVNSHWGPEEIIELRTNIHGVFQVYVHMTDTEFKIIGIDTNNDSNSNNTTFQYTYRHRLPCDTFIGRISNPDDIWTITSTGTSNSAAAAATTTPEYNINSVIETELLEKYLGVLTNAVYYETKLVQKVLEYHITHFINEENVRAVQEFVSINVQGRCDVLEQFCLLYLESL